MSDATSPTPTPEKTRNQLLNRLKELEAEEQAMKIELKSLQDEISEHKEYLRANPEPDVFEEAGFREPNDGLDYYAEREYEMLVDLDNVTSEMDAARDALQAYAGATPRAPHTPASLHSPPQNKISNNTHYER